jgi:hypothetical protein
MRSVESGVIGEGLITTVVAGAQRRQDVPDRDHHREVPGRDRADDAERLAAQLDAALVGVLQHLDRQLEAGGVAGPGHGGAELPARAEAVERLSLLGGEDARELLGVLLEPGRDRLAGGAQGGVVLGGPAHEGALRGRDCGVELGGACVGGAARFRAGRGLRTVKPWSVATGPPSMVSR